MPVVLNELYGRLYTIGRIHHRIYADGETPRQYWLCSCACGSPFVIVRSDQLTTGRTVSCGCSRRTSLGMSGSRTYKTWAAMRRRCNDPKHPHYDDYGGRGILVCDRWNDPRSGFKAFVEDMGIRPEGMTLDRRDVNSHYTNDNCKWSTLVEQRWNRRDMIKQRADEGIEAEHEYWDQVEREHEQNEQNEQDTV